MNRTLLLSSCTEETGKTLDGGMSEIGYSNSEVQASSYQKKMSHRNKMYSLGDTVGDNVVSLNGDR